MSTNTQDYIKAINNHGGEVYVVGGAVRNYIYNCYHNKNVPIKDYDYLIRCIDQDTLIRVLKPVGTVKEVGQSFGIVLFVPHGTNDQIEFALPRLEKSTGPHYRDFEIITDHTIDLKTDFARRDATINAIAIKIDTLDDLKLLDHNLHPIVNTELFADPYDGISDLQNKLWRCVGNPEMRFTEDPTRIMRAFRQSTELELEIDNVTFESICNNYELMKELIPRSSVRLYNELFRMIKSNNDVTYYLNEMKKLNILNFLDIHTLSFTDITPDKNMITKILLLLRPETISCDMKKWCNINQIAATLYISQTDVHMLIAAQKFIDDARNAAAKYDILKLNESIYKLFGHESQKILQTLINYINIIEPNAELYEQQLTHLNSLSSYPQSTNDLCMDGNMLMTKWNINGANIKTIKNKLIDLIFMDKLLNDIQQLEKYINDIQQLDD
jgi:tRNA nucleotidyltransferase/poly(A) polymerase